MEEKQKTKRLTANAVNLLVTCLVLFVAVQLSDGGSGFATKLNKITANLNRAVQAMASDVSYTNWTDTSNYVSSTHFNAKGMAGLYNLTKKFINSIAPDDIIMDGILTINSNQFNVNLPDSTKAAKYYQGLVAMLVFLALCVVLFPVCGLCFCCCRCCGNCGARSQPADKSKDTCKKVLLGFLLILCGTGLLILVVCAFVSNQQLDDGLDALPKNLQNSVDDTNTYMDSTNGHIGYLLKDNYQEFTAAISTNLDSSTDIVMEELENYTNATKMTFLFSFVQNFTTVKETLLELKNETNLLRVYASQLNDALRKVKRDLYVTVTECGPLCSEIQPTIANLQTNIDFNHLPDLSNQLAELDKPWIDDIASTAQDGQKKLEEVKQKINSSLSDSITKAKQELTNAGKTINNNWDEISDTINQTKKQLSQSSSDGIDWLRRHISDYKRYIFYGGIAISCALLLVTVCIVLGLICGVCGKRPDGYNDNCCNKGAGSQFLICAVIFMFLFGFIISVFTLASMLLGVIAEKVVCEPIKTLDPNTSRLIKLLDSYNLNLADGVDLTPVSLLQNCHLNKSIYNTFNLKNKFDIDKIIADLNIDKDLDNLDISNWFENGDFDILSKTQLENLENLKNFDPGNLDKFSSELENNFTNYSLEVLSNNLTTIYQELEKSPDPDKSKLAPSLKLSVLHLNTYNEKLLEPMKQVATKVIVTSQTLNENLKMGQNSFQEAIEKLIEDVNSTQQALSVNGTAALTEVAEEFKKVIKAQISSYTTRIQHQIKNEIGLCGPLSLVVNATLTSTCNKVLMPSNGFWFSLFWTIILYVITLTICVKLASLYQKYKPYGQYVETRAKRGKKKGKKSKRYEERSAPGREAARDYTTGQRPPDARYADMAPKHWEDFPNGGPPHYQRAPTEYERPPPYYYPGSGGEQ